MWLAPDHRRSDTASGQAPSNLTKDIDKFIHDGRSYGDRPDGEVGQLFCPTMEAIAMALGVEVTKVHGVYNARESSATEPPK